VLVAVWLAILTGLVEGVCLYVFQEMRLLTQNMSLVSVSVKIIWISILFDITLFALVGLALAAGNRIVGKLPWMRITVFVCLFLMFLDWLLLIGRMRMSAIGVLALGLAAAGTRLYVARKQQARYYWQNSLRWVFAIPLIAILAIQAGIWAKEWADLARLPEAPKSPNVIVIILDALRADHLSSLGYFRKTTPNLDRLASQGVSFQYAISASTWSQPSHASLLTGAFPFEHKSEGYYFESSLPTMAEVFQRHGYRTGAVSANSVFFCRRVGFGRGFISFDDHTWSVPDMASRTLFGRKLETLLLPRLGIPNRVGRRWAPDVNRAVLDWIGDDTQRPFLLFLNYIDVHEPFAPPQPYRGKFSDIPDPGGYVNWWFRGNRPNLTAEQLRREVEAHDGALAYLDESIGKLIDDLQKRGVAKNTIVVITADHGQPLGDHGYYLHGYAPYMPLIRVPLIVLYPGHVPAGVSIARPVSNVAIAATTLDLAGLRPEPSFSAESLVALWKNSERTADWPLPLSEKGIFSDDTPVKSIVGPQWHYMENAKGQIELYDIVADPKELTNLAQFPDYTPIVREFHNYLTRLTTENSRAKAPAELAIMKPNSGQAP
jgi:arylsulfatase A-like enzyme